MLFKSINIFLWSIFLLRKKIIGLLAETNEVYMRALLKNTTGITVDAITPPAVTKDNDVIIDVALAGLCRTDVFVAEGRIAGKVPQLVLGHEFSGIVIAAGDNANIKTGQRVTAMPVLPCGSCALCTAGRGISCQHTTMLGIEHDGAFAEQVKLPASAVYTIPDHLSFRHAAYSEPVAAALSVLKSGIQPTEKGVIYGNNRFGQLIERILRAYGFGDVTLFDPAAGGAVPEGVYDFAIETLATTETLRDLMRMVRVQGRIVLKSRKHEPVGLVLAEAVRREITLSAVNYGDFRESIDLMASGRIVVDDLLGEEYGLDDYADVFEKSKTHEVRKVFFDPRK
jgi:L-iditol 2-dehydrogenase